MIGVFYNTKGIIKKIQPKNNGVILFECSNNHTVNYLIQKRKHYKDGRTKVLEVCPICEGRYATIREELKDLNNKIKKED